MKCLQRHTWSRCTASGFTIPEIALSIAIVSMLAAAVLPMGIRFASLVALTQECDQFEQSLIQAHQQAVAQLYDSAHGVAVVDDHYLRYVGDAYAARDTRYDAVTMLQSGHRLSGGVEVTFQQRTGFVQTDTVFTISDEFDQTRVVHIRTDGVIEQL